MASNANNNARDGASSGVDLLGPLELCLPVRTGFRRPAMMATLGPFELQKEREGKVELGGDNLGALTPI